MAAPRDRVSAALPFVALLAAAFPWIPAQGQAGGEIDRLADELRQLREGVEESNRVGWVLFAVSLAVGSAIALIAAWGTIRNTRELAKHVALVEKDMDKRLRPFLVWTADGDMPSHTFAVIDGNQIKVRIINAGQVAAVGIVCDVRVGLEADFEAGNEVRSQDQWGSLAPNKCIEIDIPLADEHVLRVKGKKEKFRIDVRAEYRGPDGKEYEYSMSGRYDGANVILRD